MQTRIERPACVGRMTDQLSDATLLERFVNLHEEAAFATLVQRHGPQVLRVCRRILQNQHDAEEVSQATFLVLARRAAEIPWRDSVSSWLCAVAQRLSLNARAGASRRSRHEVHVAVLAGTDSDSRFSSLPEEWHPQSQADPLAEIARRELQRVLDEELSCLPEKYRAPMVLCYLEGMTNEEAARELGWPSGSMSRRLERARSILRQRLASRGMLIALIVLSTVALTLSGWRSSVRPARGLVMAREAMVSFKAHQDGGEGLERMLTEIVRDDTSRPSLRNALLVARGSARVAHQIEGIDPGRDREIWSHSATGMYQSAVAMLAAAERGDSAEVLAEARQLNQRCLQCHIAFRR